jgi:hypothetical protein
MIAIRPARTGAIRAESPKSNRGPDRRLLPSEGRWAAALRGRPPVELTTWSRKSFTWLAFAPSGGYLAASVNDGTVKIFEAGEWTVARAYEWGVGKVQSVAVGADGLLTAAGGDTGRVVVWDVDT